MPILIGTGFCAYQSWLLDKGPFVEYGVHLCVGFVRFITWPWRRTEAPFVPNLFKDVFTGVESKRKKALLARCWSVAV